MSINESSNKLKGEIGKYVGSKDYFLEANRKYKTVMNKNRIDYFINLSEIIDKIQSSTSEIHDDISKNIKIIHCISK